MRPRTTRKKTHHALLVRVLIVVMATGLFFLGWTRTQPHDDTSLSTGAASVASSTRPTGIPKPPTNLFRMLEDLFSSNDLEEEGELASHQGVLWVGLKNSDDQGTQFDLRAEVYQNSSLVAAGEKRCVTGITRNPDKALQVLVPLEDIAETTFAPGDQLSFKAFARVGTTEDGKKCPGPGGSHASAIGLRLYYDGQTRVSGFTAQLDPDAAAEVFVLHGGNSGDFLNHTSPSSLTPRMRDSGVVNFARNNPWMPLGTWLLNTNGSGTSTPTPTPTPSSSFRFPTEVFEESLWQEVENMFAADNEAAQSCPPGAPAVLGDFGFSGIGGTILGIEVECKASKAAVSTCSGGQGGGQGNLELSLSWNGGVSSTARRDFPFTSGLSTIPVIATLGGPTDTWGRTWSAADFTNANFRLLVGHSNNEGAFEVDFCRVRVISNP